MFFFLAKVRSSSRPSSKTALTNMGSGSMGEWRDASMDKAHSSPPIRAKKSEVFLVLEGLMQIAVVPEDEDLRILFRRGTQPLPPALRSIEKLEEFHPRSGACTTAARTDKFGTPLLREAFCACARCFVFDFRNCLVQEHVGRVQTAEVSRKTGAPAVSNDADSGAVFVRCGA